MAEPIRDPGVDGKHGSAVAELGRHDDVARAEGGIHGPARAHEHEWLVRGAAAEETRSGGPGLDPQRGYDKHRPSAETGKITR